MPPLVRVVTTAELSSADLDAIPRLMDAAFDDFSDDDWAAASTASLNLTAAIVCDARPGDAW
jgi:hypothetical protein